MTEPKDVEVRLLLETAIELTEWFKQQGIPPERAMRAMDLVKAGMLLIDTLKASAGDTADG